LGHMEFERDGDQVNATKKGRGVLSVRPEETGCSFNCKKKTGTNNLHTGGKNLKPNGGGGEQNGRPGHVFIRPKVSPSCRKGKDLTSRTSGLAHNVKGAGASNPDQSGH